MALIKFFIGQDQPQINSPPQFNGAGKMGWTYGFLDFRKKSRKNNPKNPVNPV